MNTARPNFRFRKQNGCTMVEALFGDKWRTLTSLQGSRGKWTIHVNGEVMGPYQTRWKAASAYADRFFKDPAHEEYLDILRWWRRQPFGKDDINEEIANEIFNILKKHCGIREDNRHDFVANHVLPARSVCTEYRLLGNKIGCKFRNYSGWWVDCYREEENYNSMSCILEANTKLKDLWQKHYGDMV